MQKKNKKRLYYVVLIIIGGVIGALEGRFGVLSGFLGLYSPVDYLSLIPLLGVAFYLTVIVHELGHLCMGSLVGFRLIRFNTLILTVVRVNDRLKWRLEKMRKGQSYIGYCAMMPKDETVGNKAYAWFFLGGLLMNALICVLLIIAFAVGIDSALTRRFLGLLLALNGLFFLFNLWPRKEGMLLTDGLYFKSLYREVPQSAKIRALFNLSGALGNGKLYSEVEVTAPYHSAFEDVLDYSLAIVTGAKAHYENQTALWLKVAGDLEDHLTAAPGYLKADATLCVFMAMCTEERLDDAKGVFEKLAPLAIEESTQQIMGHAYKAVYLDRDAEAFKLWAAKVENLKVPASDKAYCVEVLQRLEAVLRNC